MVSKEILIQYSDLQEEIKYLRKKINSLQNEQASIEKCKKRSLVESSSKDFPYTKHKVHTDGYVGLTNKSAHYLNSVIDAEIQKLESRYEKLLEVTNDIMDFIESIEDSRMRMIVTYRFIEGFSWNKVADCIGGDNTEDGVRMAFNRFMENN